jgi:hypothetical protein
VTAALATDFCPQCYRDRPLVDFISKSGRRFVRHCKACRDHYGNYAKLSTTERIAKMRARPKPRTGIGYMAALTVRSGNRKTGPIPVSMTDQASCPTSCTFRDAGCYAEFGKLRMHWENVAKNGDSWAEFCRSVAALPPGTLWRHNEAGDLPGEGNRLDTRALDRLVAANGGRRGFTFTHKPANRVSEQMAIARANRGGFTINLSADSLADADRLADRKIGPVAVVLAADAPSPAFTPAGRRVVECLYETKGLTCAECGYCAVAERQGIVGFRAHGQASALVSSLVQLRKKPAARPAVVRGAA